MFETQDIGRSAGNFGFAIGALALVLVFLHFWVGPFAPQDSATVTLGELAVDIKQAAIDKVRGVPKAAPEAAPWDIDRVLRAITAVFAALAILAGAVAYVRGGPKRLAAAAVALGVGAATFQFLIMAFYAMVFLLLIYIIFSQFDGVLDF
jgi:hypothetical protein